MMSRWWRAESQVLESGRYVGTDVRVSCACGVRLWRARAQGRTVRRAAERGCLRVEAGLGPDRALALMSERPGDMIA